MKALTVKQPWAHLIAKGGKIIENRTWKTNYRGPLLIQASAGRAAIDLDELERSMRCSIDRDDLHLGVTIAIANLSDIVTSHTSKWFEGPYGWVLSDVTPVPAMPMKGKQSLFDPPPDIRAAIKKHMKR